MALQERLVLLATLDRLALPVTPAILALRRQSLAPLDPPAPLATQATLALRRQSLETQAILDLQELRLRPALQEIQVQLATLARQEHLGQLVCSKLRCLAIKL